MQPDDAVPAPPPDASQSSPAASEPLKPSGAVPRRPIVWALAAALVAGVISWLGGEQLRETYRDALGFGTVEKPAMNEARQHLARQLEHIAVTYGLFGGLLGAALGVAGGLARGSTGRGVLAGLAGLVLGGAAGAGVSMAVIPIHARHYDGQDSLMLALLMHGAIWIPIGAAAGLALGLGLGGVLRSLHGFLGGLLGAAVATMLFEVAGALVFPADATSQPLSGTWITRLLAWLFVAALSAACAVVCARAAATRS